MHWLVLMLKMDVDAAEYFLRNTIFVILDKYVPKKIIFEHKSTHPWLTDAFVEAVRTRNAARGTEEFASLASQCSDIIFKSYLNHIASTRLATLQLLSRNHCEVFSRFFQSVSQKVVCGDLVPEYWVGHQSTFQIIWNTDQVL